MFGEDGSANRSSQIDENLKRVYKDVLDEDMPDRFKELLERLNAQENSGDQKKDGEEDA